MTRPRIQPLALLLVLLVALLAVGCGSNDSASTDSGSGDAGTETDGGGSDSGGSDDLDGKSLFTSTCGGCHTLSDAGTSGAAGPNLDQVAPDAERVKSMIASGGGAMPAGLLEGAEADAVAEYVAGAAGG